MRPIDSRYKSHCRKTQAQISQTERSAKGLTDRNPGKRREQGGATEGREVKQRRLWAWGAAGQRTGLKTRKQAAPNEQSVTYQRSKTCGLQRRPTLTPSDQGRFAPLTRWPAASLDSRLRCGPVLVMPERQTAPFRRSSTKAKKGRTRRPVWSVLVHGCATESESLVFLDR